MLGSAPAGRFKRASSKSTATFKVIFNELPIQQYYALPYDRWEGFEAERQKLLKFLADNVKNVVFLTTDVHANLVNDARLKTLESGGPVDRGIRSGHGPDGDRELRDGDQRRDRLQASAGAIQPPSSSLRPRPGWGWTAPRWRRTQLRAGHRPHVDAQDRAERRCRRSRARHRRRQRRRRPARRSSSTPSSAAAPGGRCEASHTSLRREGGSLAVVSGVERRERAG